MLNGKIGRTKMVAASVIILTGILCALVAGIRNVRKTGREPNSSNRYESSYRRNTLFLLGTAILLLLGGFVILLVTSHTGSA